MDKLKMHTPDLAEENYRKLAALFPNAVTETVDENGEVVRAIDADVLRQEISAAVVEGAQERYQFTWPDKKKSVVLANQPIAKTLRLDRAKSVGRDGTPGSIDTENIYIEGDNLDALKLLQETYLGRVKMIYIDPPYNTGNDFIYEDDFAQETGEYLAGSGQFDTEGNRLVQNLEGNGRFHTDWLNMMYPRLRLAKDLLADDGVIIISIDDCEVQNMRKICDEIFGRDNFIAEFPRVTKRGGKSTNTFAKNHDYVLVYCKNTEYATIFGISHIDSGFKNRDEYYDQRGPYKLNQTLDYNTLGYVNSLDYPIVIDEKAYYAGGITEEEYLARKADNPQDGFRWRWSKKKFEFGYKNGWIVVSKSGRLYTKTYLKASIGKTSNGDYCIEYSDRTKPVSTLDTTENQFSNDNSAKEFQSLMGKSLFEYVKPTSLINLFLTTCSDKNSIILDFFSGSATTAHAVLQLNAEDGGHRKFILVQLPEATDEKSEAYKAGFKTICEIGEERIRRAGKKIIEGNDQKKDAFLLDTEEDVQLFMDIAQHGPKAIERTRSAFKTVDLSNDIDVGFRVFRVDSSNMKDVYYRPEEFTQAQLNLFADNIKPDRTPEDLLFQVMLDLGVLLSESVEQSAVAGKTVYRVAGNYLIACFDKNITEEVVTEIAKQTPAYFVTRDSSMASDSLAANFDQIFATYSPDTIRKVL